MDQASDLARTLYFGDNLHILRTHLAADSVDLIYLDPPFYSQRSYQAVVKAAHSNGGGQSRVPAFGDIWRWDATVAQSYAELLVGAPDTIARAMAALRALLGPGPLLAYLVMIAERLLELRRVLKPAGSLYLHCDPAASHYLKLLLDAVFGAANFRNEIVWSYKTGGASQRHFARKHDLLFFYSKSEQYIFHAPKEKSYMMHRYGFKKSTFHKDEQGEYTWVYMKDVWELPALGAADAQRLGYPTQKPEALLERILQASSSQGALVLDPFCGSGTTLTVAQRLGRNWLGIEKNALGLAYQRYRLARTFPDLCYTTVGGPTTLAEARHLAQTDASQFRWWALSLVCARPAGAEKGTHAGLAHGILSDHSGAHLLVVVALDPLEFVAIQRWRTQLCQGDHTRLLIIALEPPLDGLRAELATVSPLFQIVTIAELLSSTALHQLV